MTKSKYFLAIILQKFGVTRKTKRLTDASYETHLMHDGEEILGAFCWRDVAEIEDLSLEYWNLKGLDRERKELLEKIAEAESHMMEAQAHRTSLFNSVKEGESEIARERAELAGRINSLQEEHDGKMAAVLATKKRHTALKTKLKFLEEEEETEERKSEIKECLNGLADLRETFISQKQELEELKNRIDSRKAELNKIEKKIGEGIRSTEGETNKAYGSISKANREITGYRAKLSAIEEEQDTLFREIGHFLNINANRGDCLKAAKKHRIILTQLRLLFRSIKLNQQLVERLGG